jgi:hypothetical protein
MRMRFLSSSSIASAGYDRGRQRLRLRYVGGAIYEYLKVPAKVFQDLLDAPSKGQFVNGSVKPFYPYVRLS